jgi:hypothetical protein
MIAKTDYSDVRNNIYYSTKFDSLLEELKNRSENKDIDAKLTKYWDSHQIPYIDFLKGGPYAILSRSVASPNFEQLRFLRFAKRYNLTPVILEYDGKFVTINTEKLCLCKMHFLFDQNSREYKTPHKIDLVDTNKYQGKRMSEILTYSNKPLIDFHHNLFLRYSNNKTCKIFNFTTWFNETRILADEYYFYFLLIFIKNAVLFDNYLISEPHESGFVEKKIIPSINRIKEVFGLKPLIYPLVPFKTENSTKWLSYEQKIENLVENELKKD